LENGEPKLKLKVKDKGKSVSRNDTVLSVESVCRQWAEILETNNIPEARVSAEYIVAHILGKKTVC
jgi:hypothetical protein